MSLFVPEHGAVNTVPYNQSDDFPHMSLDSDARNGVCMAISTYWMVRHSQKKEYWNWLKSVQGIATIINTQGTGCRGATKNISATPGGYSSADGADWFERISGTLTKNNMLQLGVWHNTTRFMEAAEWILKDTGQYKFIYLSGDAGAHAVAAHVSDKILFMDPNVGEVTFPAKGNFMAWFPGYLRRYLFQDAPGSPVKTFSKVGVNSFGVTRPRS